MDSALAAIVSLIVGFILGCITIINSSDGRDAARVRDGWMTHGGKMYIVSPAKPALAAP